jgi:ribosomal protein S6
VAIEHKSRTEQINDKREARIFQLKISTKEQSLEELKNEIKLEKELGSDTVRRLIELKSEVAQHVKMCKGLLHQKRMGQIQRSAERNSGKVSDPRVREAEAISK